MIVRVTRGPDDGHYAPDPTTGANPNTNGAACTVAQFVAALTDHSGSGTAKEYHP
ncbi:MAG TPA: hypothetical protein VGM75_31995 [Pseudonocardiaceae bacterium]